MDQTSCDPALSKLLLAIEFDFHGDVSNSNLTQPYLPFREGCYVFDGIILYRDRIVAPVSLRGTVLKAWHAAHQGVSAMERRARAAVFWPGMTQQINNVHNSSVHCNFNVPAQTAIPSMSMSPPTTSFEHIFADYFHYGGRHFSVIGDKFSSGQVCLGHHQSQALRVLLLWFAFFWTYFATFGVPDEILTNGCLKFTAFVTWQFLKTWDVEHHVSSIYFLSLMVAPRLLLKLAAKRLLVANVSPSGNSNKDTFLQALLQLRNAFDPHCDMLPAEIVFGPSSCAISSHLLFAYLSLPIVRYDVHGVKRGEPKRRPSSASGTQQRYTTHKQPLLMCLALW